ncbi:MAG TPA: transketolase C-terminal domain-containing protein [Candidatus Binatia bacterium]|nr:transketolase C-terminal domain-containing protein [Candidatus Binatia bacterium]
MLKQVEGSRATAEAVARCRPQVVCAYPISPQTHIVEELSQLVKLAELSGCEYINVESEFAAMSVAIGASVAGARAYTATSSQGFLFMVEAVYNAAGLGLPIVMTMANRALGAPINIWNDQSDSISQRDSGWIQMYAENNQVVADLHIQAFKIAEALSLPVMVCMDGFILTHAVEQVDIPDQEAVDAFLPPFVPRQVLDPEHPVTIGAMVGPEAFMEVRYLGHLRQLEALQVIPQVAAEFAEKFGRDSGGLVQAYRLEDAETVIVALGSVLGTIKDAVDDARDRGVKIGVLGITTFRPFPAAAICEGLRGARRVVVIEKALAPGVGGIVSDEIRVALAASPLFQAQGAPPVWPVIAGLGGRPVTKAALRRLFDEAINGRLRSLTFLDLNSRLIEAEVGRLSETPAGRYAEQRLQDIGVVAAEAR